MEEMQLTQEIIDYFDSLVDRVNREIEEEEKAEREKAFIEGI